MVTMAAGRARLLASLAHATSLGAVTGWMRCGRFSPGLVCRGHGSRSHVGRALVRAASSAAPPPQPLGQDPSELFDLYAAPADVAVRLPAGAQPRPLGATKQRGEVHRAGDWHRSVHVWLVDAHGRLLVQQRSAHKDTFPGRWDVSAAGHVSAGSEPFQTAREELREELGLSVSLDALRAGWVCTLPSCARGSTKAGEFVCNEFQDLFVLPVPEGALDQPGTLALGADEVAAVRMVAAAELLGALEREDEAYVPRAAHYRSELRAALARLRG